MKYFLEVFFQEIRLNLKLLGQLLVLAIIASLLELMAGAFSHEGISHLTRAVVSMVLIFILISSLQSVLGYGQGTIKAVVDIMIALLPLLIALLMSMGAVTSAAVFQPIVLLGITYMSNVISNLVLPLIFFAAILALINGFSKDFNISKLAKLLRDVSVALLGSILIIFSGLMALQGTAVAVGDGLAMRAAKYLTGAVVPVFGSMFADALELVAGCSLLIKNALGLVGLLGLIIVTVFPLVKIFAIIVVYKLVAALIEPLGEVNMAETLSELGNILVFLLLAVAAVAIMAFVCLTMIVGLANVIVMLR